MFTKPILAAGLGVAMLAGCAISNDKAVPDLVNFTGERLSVYFSNGMICRAEGIRGSASGVFEQCPVPVRYEVVTRSPGHFGAGWTEPYADITVIMPDGRQKLLKTPESRNWTGRWAEDEMDED